jgi:hypothetical protein
MRKKIKKINSLKKKLMKKPDKQKRLVKRN